MGEMARGGTGRSGGGKSFYRCSPGGVGCVQLAGMVGVQRGLD